MTKLRLPIDGVFCFMEIWKEVPGYEDLYEVSSLGRVKSLSNNGDKKEKIRVLRLDIHGYLSINLSNKKIKRYKVHQLVAMAFLGHTPCGNKLVVDHINGIKTDNRLENLQIVTIRYNSRKTQVNYSSQYKGVSFSKNKNRWIARIQIDGKSKYLGMHKTELEASEAYQNKLKEIV
jgi:hypothetical protein